MNDPNTPHSTVGSALMVSAPRTISVKIININDYKH